MVVRSHLTILSLFLPDRKFNYHHCTTSASLFPLLTRWHSSEGNLIAFHSLTWNRILLGPLCTELHSEVTTSLWYIQFCSFIHSRSVSLTHEETCLS